MTHIGPIEPLALQPVIGEAGAITDPFLVDVLVQARQHPQHLAATGVDPDIAADRIQHVDRLGLAQLPRAGIEGVGLGGQGADRADVDHVAGQFRRDRLFDIGADLHMLTAPGGAELGRAGDLVGEPDAAGAVDAPCHEGLDQRPEILLLDRPLVLLEAAAVEAVGHGLVLQIALAALVADRAIQRVVDQQKLHDALARLVHHLGIGADHHALAAGHGAGCDRLGRALHLDQAHAAIGRNRQALVIAESRDLDAELLTGLQHRRARLDLDFHPVDGQFRHALASHLLATATAANPKSNHSSAQIFFLRASLCHYYQSVWSRSAVSWTAIRSADRRPSQ